MDAKTIQKYSKYSVAELKKKAQIKFNAYIRKRDSDKYCISCQRAKVEQAGHFYSAGHFNQLRYNELNTHGQCVRCNYFLSGNLSEYRRHLEKRIGKDNLEILDELAEQTKRNRSFKYDRFQLIEIIETYGQKTKDI